MKGGGMDQAVLPRSDRVTLYLSDWNGCINALLFTGLV